jgi:tRNA A37 methylthiotransferase MiaB
LEELLRRLAAVPGILRTRVSYLQPAETRPSLVAAITGTPGVADYFDLSFQHASAQVLRRMRRFGDPDSFLGLLADVRRQAPGAGVRSNFIVGFPGETEADFRATYELMEDVRYNSAYVFMYSPRPHTPAAELTEGRVPREVAVERLGALNGLQRAIGASYLMAKVGSIEKVLVQGPARRGEGRLTGWTEHRETVVLPGGPAMGGKIVPVEIEALAGITLHGRPARARLDGRPVLEIPVLAG